MSNEHPGYLTPEQLETRWGGRIKVRTLANWRTSGNGPPFTKIGGAVLYNREKLEQWEDTRTVTSTSNYSKD